MATHATPPVKASWIWDTQIIEKEKDGILDFAKQNQVNVLYLQIDPAVSESSYRAFIQAASDLGIRIDALNGDPHWALPSQQRRIADFVNWVKTYNGSVRAEEKFQGVHLDMEPYALPEWKTERGTVVRYWMDAISEYKKAADEASLFAGADLPFWVDGILTSDDKAAPSLGEWIIGRLDQVTVMAYRDKAEGSNGIMAVSAGEMEAAERLGKSIVVAVDTIPSSEAGFVTFYEEGKAAMNAELQLVENALKDRPSFAGIAVHHIVGWRELKD